MNAINLIEIKKFYHDGEQTIHAVNGITLAVEEGEFTAVAGPSGSGKTTLLNLAGGLDRPDSGEITIGGLSLREKTDDELAEIRLHKIGFVFQAYNLIPVLTAYENVQFILQIQGISEREHKDRILALFTDLGINGLEHRFPAQLSGGQQQRVAVARAMVGKPTIVLADEPTANLDSDTATNLLKIMRLLNEEKRMTFLFSTHDPRVIAEARRVIWLHDGNVEREENKSSAHG